MKVKACGFFMTTTWLWLFLLCTPLLSYAQTAPGGVKIIVLDPGHGGKDPGTHYKDFLEKDINLNVALMLGELITKNLPDVKVVYTRKTDVFVPLMTRGDIANKAGADLFLSIHVNAVNPGVQSPSGALTLVMGTKDADRNLTEAMRENDVITYEDDYSTKYEGYVPGSTESFIMFSLMQYANIDQSLSFANTIQKHYKISTPMPDKGIRQQPILVLWKTTMPSVLTELGFLSNATDRATLTTKSGQRKLATALFNAVSEYKANLEGRSTPIQLENLPDATSDDASTGTEKSSVAQDNQVVYCVQVSSSPKRVSTNSTAFKSYRGKVTERRIGRYYKYYVGECATYQEASTLLKTVKKTFSDAFLVAFRGDKQIPLGEARKLTE